eukprot:scaffold11423_cov123-Isochrysis_galbana.AAC.10
MPPHLYINLCCGMCGMRAAYVRVHRCRARNRNCDAHNSTIATPSSSAIGKLHLTHALRLPLLRHPQQVAR